MLQKYTVESNDLRANDVSFVGSKFYHPERVAVALSAFTSRTNGIVTFHKLTVFETTVVYPKSGCIASVSLLFLPQLMRYRHKIQSRPVLLQRRSERLNFA